MTSETVSFYMAGEAMSVEATYEEKPSSGSSSSGSSSGSGSSGGSYSGSSTYIPPKEPEQETDKEPTLAERPVTEQQETLLMKLYPELTDALWEQYL